MSVDPVTNFIAGGLAGAAGTTFTCPLEVVKTRLQSTVGQNVLQQMCRFIPEPVSANATVQITARASRSAIPLYIRHVLATEGLPVLFKGLAPSLFGIIPTRALYFTSYSQAKQRFNKMFPYESPLVHLSSAITAGVFTTTCTSPIWVVKTQLQLDSSGPGTALRVWGHVRHIHTLDGIKGFYRGLTASYAGTAETAIHFVIYEHIKKVVARRKNADLGACDFVLAAAFAKLTASSICYPHEVCRTRLRQKVHPDKRRYHSFFQTLMTVWREEGPKGLYGGMVPHLCRVIPNTAIVFLTYEGVVKLFDHWNTGNTPQDLVAPYRTT